MPIHTIDQCPDRLTCELHRLVPAPEIPEEAKPYVVAYLRWLGDDEGVHGGMLCRWDRNAMLEQADRIEGTGRNA
jgi:hypothetical protein